MEREQVELRAERLRVLVAVAGEDAALDGAEAARCGLPALSGGEAALFASAGPEDRALADACLAAGREARGRAWDAVEDYLAVAPDDGDVTGLDWDEFGRAVRALIGSGLAWAAPSGPRL